MIYIYIYTHTYFKDVKVPTTAPLIDEASLRRHVLQRCPAGDAAAVELAMDGFGEELGAAGGAWRSGGPGGDGMETWLWIPSGIYGLCMDNLWLIYGLYMDNLWIWVDLASGNLSK